VNVDLVEHYVNGNFVKKDHYSFYRKELQLDKTTVITRQKIHHAYHQYLNRHERYHGEIVPEEVMEGKAAELYLLDRWEYLHGKN